MLESLGFKEVLPKGVVRVDSLKDGDHCVRVDCVAVMTVLRYSTTCEVKPDGSNIPARLGDSLMVMMLDPATRVKPCDKDGNLLPVEEAAGFEVVGVPGRGGQGYAKCPDCGKLCVKDFPLTQPAVIGLRWFTWRCFGCGWESERQDDRFYVPSPDELLREKWEALNK